MRTFYTIRTLLIQNNSDKPEQIPLKIFKQHIQRARKSVLCTLTDFEPVKEEEMKTDFKISMNIHCATWGQ